MGFRRNEEYLAANETPSQLEVFCSTHVRPVIIANLSGHVYCRKLRKAKILPC